MRFKVSTNIKNILGKDMISNKYIAIFELVKNSCDAGAKNVDIEFVAENNLVKKIIITDDGHGMTSQDLQDKWLFMAYSEKRHDKNKNKYAGSKGIGRFSCDRLGKSLVLTTRKRGFSNAERLLIDWELFEKNDVQRVEEIDLKHESLTRCDFLKDSGTRLEILNLREQWERDDIIRLRSSLMKLVSPDKVDKVENTIISIIAEHEKDNDAKALETNVFGKRNSGYGNLIVNGPIINDVFEKLNLKTTSIKVALSENGDEIETIIEDRGDFVFKIVRKNESYDKLENIKLKLFYLNRAAKYNFTKIMGIDSVNYGSVFVYKNGFRVQPYGDVGTDVFGINERKSQGYNRYLGTRELMGRILIEGENDKFVEKSSRDGGFIENLATLQLKDFFLIEVVRVLEKYVVDGIDWGDPDRDKFEIGVNDQGLSAIDAADRILQQFAGLSDRGDVISAEINPKIVLSAKPKVDALQRSIKGLEKIARVSGSADVLQLLDDIKKEAYNLKEQKEQAERDVDSISDTLRKRDSEIRTRENQIDSFKRKLSIDSAQYEDALHMIYVLSDADKVNLDKIYRLAKSDNQLLQIVADTISDIQRINKLSDLSINYNYGISPKKARDLVITIKNYVTDFWSKKINVEVDTEEKDWKVVCNFDIAKISLIIDNILSNSKKARAKNINIHISKKNDMVVILFKDDGIGLSQNIDNPENIFERGYSTTFGLGLGLYHTKLLVEGMKGEIHYDKNVKSGFALEVKFKYECRF